MGIHPYAFKGRVFVPTKRVPVRVRGHMRRAADLDGDISKAAAEIKKDEAELAKLKSRLQKGAVDKDRIRRKLERNIKSKIKSMRKAVDSYCDGVEDELKELGDENVDDDTLLYREARDLRALARKYRKKFVRLAKQSKEAAIEHMKRLKTHVETAAGSMDSIASSLELQAKYLERGGVNAVAFKEMSAWPNSFIRQRIKAVSIDIGHLIPRLKDESLRAFFEDFKKALDDIYNMGKDTNILINRLKTNFRNVKSGLRNSGITSKKVTGRIDKAEKHFKKGLGRLERLGKRMENEINDQTGKLGSDLKDVA